MGYTHYSSLNKEATDRQIDLINQMYQVLLSSISYNGGDSLLTIRKRGIEEDETFNETFNECFHEYCRDNRGNPIIYDASNNDWGFCKTARKIYDIAILLSYRLAYESGITKDFSGDWNYKIKKVSSYELEKYVKEELEDYGYNYKKLVEIFYFYKHKIGQKKPC